MLPAVKRTCELSIDTMNKPASLLQYTSWQTDEGIILGLVHVGINPVKQTFVTVGQSSHGFHAGEVALLSSNLDDIHCHMLTDLPVHGRHTNLYLSLIDQQ